ncbi:hypothetical protein [Psychrobacillus sp. AK 1817]|uniref:hypothetical protein n=1 Tax=Psychrobacillus sp. AK 1817 TaxID=2303505 RepID=UPI0017820019|nr:hypothetical protein [Psychrobacillus sp. AK 1817]
MIPAKETIHNEINNILSIDERIYIEQLFMMYGMQNQLFWDEKEDYYTGAQISY